MKVLVAGATGAIGRQLLPLLREAGADVVALARSEARRRWLGDHEFRFVGCDALDETSVHAAFREVRPDVVINQLTAIPPRMNPRRIGRMMARTNQLRSQGTRVLMDAAVDVGVRTFVSQSIAFAYAPGAGVIVDEDRPLYDAAPSGFDAAVHAIRQCEDITLRTPGISGIVLRYGHLYGPGTVYAPGGATYEAVKKRQMPIIGRGLGHFSFVHVGDAAAATVTAALSTYEGTFNIVDNEPAAVSQWLPSYAKALGARQPVSVPGWLGRAVAGRFAEYMMTSQPGASNKRARDVLQWQPDHPTWHDNLACSAI